MPPVLTSTRPPPAIVSPPPIVCMAGATASVAPADTATVLEASGVGAASRSVPSATVVGPASVPPPASVSTSSPAFVSPKPPPSSVSGPARITSAVPPAVFVTAKVASASSVTVAV